MTAPNFKLEKQSSSTVVFRKGATTLPGQLQAEYQTRNTTKPRSSAELFSPGWTAAVYSDHKSCSDIGRAILLRGGNAVDAAIASALCLSAALPHRGGLGGGLMATIYSDSLCTTLNSRSQFINETTRKPLAEGEMMLCPQLANFLSDISDFKNPVDYFYRGEGTTRLLKAMNDEDAFITARDLDDFESEFQAGIHSNLRQSTLCGPAPPSVFSVVQLAVATMLEANSNSSTIAGFAWDLSAHISDPLFDSDIMNDVEKMLNGRGVEEVLHRFRNENRSKVKWQPTEEGSFSVFAIDENGNAASIVSSLGDKFGSRLFTNLGFFLNNAMGAFTYDTQPGSVRSRNAPQPAKGPRTQMSPVIGKKSAGSPLARRLKQQRIQREESLLMKEEEAERQRKRQQKSKIEKPKEFEKRFDRFDSDIPPDSYNDIKYQANKDDVPPAPAKPIEESSSGNETKKRRSKERADLQINESIALKEMSKMMTVLIIDAKELLYMLGLAMAVFRKSIQIPLTISRLELFVDIL
ncbi:unnamed protein product [Heligmosomoides polygyrus]|uniref:Gamma-glutamyltransferase n=1 Tax=Heligmosomoides polygyrus TaxID=6339 RepID=A0A3P7ZE65_HELPZ|nr:unnamed protein product [Heligmosomoides polygyrus]